MGVINTDYSKFAELFGNQPEKYFVQNFTKEELLALMRLPYIALDYGSQDAWQEVIEKYDVEDLAEEIVGEGFPNDVLVRATKEILNHKKRSSISFFYFYTERISAACVTVVVEPRRKVAR